MNPLHINTPLLESTHMSTLTGKQVMLKMDSLQPSGSFKIRGIGKLCTQYFQKGAQCFVSSSGGNAGLATAYAGKKLGVRVKVVVPSTTKEIMKQKIAQEGAEVIVHGDNWNKADELARELAQQQGSCYIPPFEHQVIWEGHATLIHEVAATGFKPDAVIVCVGGGGLFCGIAQGMHDVGWDNIPIITTETEGAASFAKSVAVKQLVTLEKVDTIATSLAAKKVTPKALEWALTRPVIPVIVSDKEAAQACLQFANNERQLVEPAGGTCLSLIYQNHPVLKNYNKILVIVCGGNGVTIQLIQEWTKVD